MVLLVFLLLLVVLFGGLGIWAAKWLLIFALVFLIAALISGSRRPWV